MHCLSLNTSTRNSSCGLPSRPVLPLKRKAGIKRCAGELALPFEKTSETVPSSFSCPPVTAWFVELYVGLHALQRAMGIELRRLVPSGATSGRSTRMRQRTVEVQAGTGWYVKNSRSSRTFDVVI